MYEGANETGIPYDRISLREGDGIREAVKPGDSYLWEFKCTIDRFTCNSFRLP